MSTAEGQAPLQAEQPSGQSAAEEPLDAHFCSMVEELRQWRERFYDCIVPRKVHDAPQLGEWVHRQRALRKRGGLSPAAIAALDELGFAWRVDVITAKWYHNLHAARRYREVHGSGEIPPDYRNPEEPDWVEAGRWLERQRFLYGRQKLLLLRVRLIKDALGVQLVRAHSRPRRNLHRVLREGNAQFQEQLRQRQQQEGDEDGALTGQQQQRQRQQGQQRQQARQQRQQAPQQQQAPHEQESPAQLEWW